MPLSIVRFDPDEHTVSLNTGTQILRIRHISDVQVSVLRTALPSLENANDATGLQVLISN